MDENCKKGQCGKRPLRGLNRKKVVKEIMNKGIHVYHADKRREVQQYSDPQPSISPKDEVSSKAKSDDKISHYWNEDPVLALCILKTKNKGINVIQHIGHDPFFIYIFSNYRITLWNLYSDETPIIFDSTFGIATKICRAGNTKSHSRYLHLGIINCELGQYAICSAITGKQDTLPIQGLLMRFV